MDISNDERSVPDAGGGAAGKPAAQSSRQRLYESAEDLVEAALARLHRQGVRADEDDLRAWGRQGLLEAADRFDSSRGDFRRFAFFRVRGAMIDGLRKSGHWSRRGYERIAMLRGLASASDGLADTATGVSQTPEEAAERLHGHMASVVTAMTIGLFAEGVMEGDQVVPRDPGVSAEDLLGERQLRAQVMGALEELPEPEREIVRRHYLGGERIDLIAAEKGHTKSWGSRLHTRALRRLAARFRGE